MSRLTRNPLGIIGLFIALVYGIAGLVLGVSAQRLASVEQLLLVGFLMSFPFVLLGAFFRLVSHHHSKLYAPRDYYDNEGFYRTMTPAEREIRLDEGVKDILPAYGQSDVAAEGMGPRGNPERQPVTLISPRQEYVLAEELALREIEAEFGAAVQRDLAIGSSLLDGVAAVHGVPTAIEVKFVRGPDWRRRSEEAIGQAVHQPGLPSGMPLLIAVVLEGVSADEARELSTEFVRSFGLYQDGHKKLFKVYDLADLKAKYGLGLDVV